MIGHFWLPSRARAQPHGSNMAADQSSGNWCCERLRIGAAHHHCITCVCSTAVFNCSSCALVMGGLEKMQSVAVAGAAAWPVTGQSTADLTSFSVCLSMWQFGATPATQRGRNDLPLQQSSGRGYIRTITTNIPLRCSMLQPPCCLRLHLHTTTPDAAGCKC